jgi:hypothetical protein
MTERVGRLIVVGILVGVRSLIGGEAVAAETPNAGRVSFQRDVRPILSDKCFFCHGPDEKHREADLRLDVREGMLGDGKTKGAVIPGKVEASKLWKRISHDDPDQRMPPEESNKTLSDSERDMLRRWVEQGAEWQEHWSFAPLKRPAVPQPKFAVWPINDIDRFLLARLEVEGLAPSPSADANTLIRRLAFDLTGLPPTWEEVEGFVRAAGTGVAGSLGPLTPGPSPTRGEGGVADRAFEQVVDRLLASPHFGERMAVYWLDLVRFADTVGYHGDQEHPISPYRDWVIQAFNDNLPFDRFTTEQLAGDLLPEATIEQKIASGYNRLLQTSHEGGVQQREYLAKYSSDRVRNFGSVWLGVTLGCCECHDHKFDPISQRDFYRLAAFFADVDDLRSFKGSDTTPTKREPELEVATKLAPGDKRRTMITVSIPPRPIRVLARGDWLDDSGEIVEPGVPSVFRQIMVGLAAKDQRRSPLTPGPSPPAGARGESVLPPHLAGRATRLDLARWLTAPDHPLTARVFVNRLWKLFFGRGIAASLEDVGAQGEAPVHPELLDWLAAEFVDSGWDVKHIVKLIVTSRAYRQSSLETAALRQRDSDNRLLARQSRPRIDAEFIRDNALTVSGLLVRTVGGRSVRPYQPEGYYEFLNFPKRTYKADTGEQQYRRGLYTHWQRCYLHPMLKAFDAPSREECTAQRSISNTPQSALVQLNDPTFIEAARAFAARIVEHGGPTTDDRLRWAWRQALAREPASRELAALRRLLDSELSEFRDDRPAAEKLLRTGQTASSPTIDAVELAAWTSVARTIFNLNEFNTRN